MKRRPARRLVEALRAAGVDASCDGDHPPVTVRGGGLGGGTIRLDASASSQFLSAILLAAPCASRAVSIALDGLSSASYVEMTKHAMARFGAAVSRSGDSYVVEPRGGYRGAVFEVEPDASSATCFGAAAAITGGSVLLRGLRRDTLQGDIRFLDLLAAMGCRVGPGAEGLEVEGSPLRGISADLNAIPDSVPALAVTAAFASTPTTIGRVGHLRHKESDRIEALSAGLALIGASAAAAGNDFTITPGPLHGAVIEPRDDHRIAMSFAVAGLALGGMSVLNPECVSKSFPGFWTELEKFS